MKFKVGDKVVNYLGDELTVKWIHPGVNDFLAEGSDRYHPIKNWKKRGSITDPRKPEQMKKEWDGEGATERYQDLLSSNNQMETDLGKIRAAIGSIRFEEIVNAE